MNGNLSELIKYLDEKFGKLELDVENLRVEMLKSRERIESIEEKMATKAEVNKLLDAVDAYMK